MFKICLTTDQSIAIVFPRWADRHSAFTCSSSFLYLLFTLFFSFTVFKPTCSTYLLIWSCCKLVLWQFWPLWPHFYSSFLVYSKVFVPSYVTIDFNHSLISLWISKVSHFSSLLTIIHGPHFIFSNIWRFLIYHFLKYFFLSYILSSF